MAPFDMIALPPISDDAPAGENLELDPEFGELERAAQGKGEVQYGDTIEPAVPPDWKETAAIAQSLLTRTHDLRVLVHLAVSKLHLEGLTGFASVMRAIRSELDERWEYVHPQLDPEDDNDPMQRANALAALRHPVKVLRRIRELPIAGLVKKRQICWRDIAGATGTLELEPGQEKLTESEILGAFGDTPPEQLEQIGAALDALVVDVPAIPAVFDRKAGPATGPDFSPLVKLFKNISQDFGRYRELTAFNMAREQGGAPADPEDSAASTPGAAGGPASGAGGGAARAVTSIQGIGSLSRREDALHALDLAAAYFRIHEPSSPLPLLLDRAKRLANLGFMEILKDLAPDGLSQAQVIAGSNGE